MAFVRFLKTENLTKNIREFYVGRALMPVQLRYRAKAHTYISFKNFGVFLVFTNVTTVTVFNIKLLNFQNILTLICSFHFWHLQSANIRFSIDSKSVIRSTGLKF